MSVTSTVIKATQHVSALARLRRHERVFGKDSLFAVGAKRVIEHSASALGKVSHVTGVKYVAAAISQGRLKLKNHVVPPTATTLHRRVAVLAVGFMVGTSLLGSTFDVSNAQYSDDALAQATQEGTLIADQDGYITKAAPQTVKTERTFKDVALYSVESGDTLSGIAKRYSLNTETLMWENGLKAASTLTIGQKLNIPPANGVSHRVTTGQTIEKIAALYGVTSTKIVAMNNLQGGVIGNDQIIFIPDGKPVSGVNSGASSREIASTASAKTSGRSASRDSISRNTRAVSKGGSDTFQNTDSSPQAGKILIFPTIGELTQGFHKGHYAFDIANRSKPPIWAAASGTVVVSTMGVWAGGYGNHVVLDNGNGVQTLYGHMDHVDVKVGDHVKQGQVLGQMGNTGNVRGITGIHLHFEVIDHGVKKAPSNYY